MPKTKKTKKKTDSSVKNILLQIANAFFHNLLDQIQDGIKVRVNEFLQETKKVAIIAFLVFIGIFFIFLGMANVIDSVVKIEGAGFLFIGLLMAFIGFLLSLFRKNNQ